MKQQLILLVMITALFASCGNKTELEKKKEELVTLKKQETDLKVNLKDVKQDIEDLEEELAELDPTYKLQESSKLVTTLELEKQPFSHFIEFQAIAETKENIQVSTDQGGLVQQVYVREGDLVSKGQMLAQLDNSVILKNINELESALSLATTIFEKQERLWKQNIGSEVDYLKAKGEKDNLVNQLATVRAQLAKTQIKSPINGTVDKVHLKIGEMASPGRPAFRVVNVDNIEIVAEVPESYITTINPSDKVDVSFKALGGKTYEGQIKSVGQVIELNNRTFDVVITIKNKDRMVKPNLLANIKINDFNLESAIVIPTRLIQELKGTYFVYTAKQEEDKLIASKRIIETGKSYKGQTVVTSGLSAEDVIIDRGYRDVTDGEKIEVIEDNRSTNAAVVSEDGE